MTRIYIRQLKALCCQKKLLSPAGTFPARRGCELINIAFIQINHFPTGSRYSCKNPATISPTGPGLSTWTKCPAPAMWWTALCGKSLWMVSM